MLIGIILTKMEIALNKITSIEVILQILLNKYFTTSNCVTFISDKKLEVNSLNMPFFYFKSLDNESLLQNIVKTFDYGCRDFFVHMDDPARFMEAFEESVHLSYVRSSKRSIVILPFSDDTAALYKVLNTKAAKHTPNIIIILPDKNVSCDVFEFTTHKYVGVDDVTKPITMDHWDSCSGKFRENSNLFPHDMSNMQGKAFTASAFTYMPYVLLDVDDNMKIRGKDGTEVRLGIEFCRWINCTLEIISDDGEQWGEVYANRTGTGVLGKVLEDEADVGFDGLSYWYEKNLMMDHLVPYARSGIACVAPTPRLKPTWLNPVRPFHWTMWVAVLVTVVTCVVALVIHAQPVNVSLLMTFGMIITQSQPKKLMGPKIRGLILWLQLAGLLVSNCYSGALAVVYTVPLYEQPIETMKDLVDSNIPWAATHDVWVFSLKDDSDPQVQQLVRNFRVYDTDVLEKRGTTDDLAFVFEKLNGGNLAVPEYITAAAVPHLKLMREEIYWVHILLFTRKSSPYTEKLNDLISRINSAGILLCWEMQVLLSHANYKVQNGISRSINLHHDAETTSLKLRHMLGIFILFGFGVAASVILFVTEINVGRKHEMV